jgi:hypothetical protein
MDAYQDVCWNPNFRSISDHFYDLFIDLLGLGADITDLYCLPIKSFFSLPIWYWTGFGVLVIALF